MKKIRVNWHMAAVCAIKITFREYSQYLQYHTEYQLAKSKYRIDLLMIKVAPYIKIPLSLAHILRSYNLFEIKGIHSSITIHSYYKTIGYAALLIAEDQKQPPYTRNEISLSFLCHRKPIKLLRHLTEDCKKDIAKTSNGIYHISGDIFPAQIIIVQELAPEEALYLRCLTDHLDDARLAEQLAEDYSRHQGQQDYEDYMNQLANANLSAKGDTLMCCEGIFRLYGTSSREFYDKGFQDCADKVRGIIAEKETEIADKDVEIVNKDAVIADKDAEISRLKKLLSIQD